MVLGFVFLIILVLILFVLFCLITNNDFLDEIWPLTERIILMFISALFSSVGIKVQDTT
jgi:hypothetical protein